MTEPSVTFRAAFDAGAAWNAATTSRPGHDEAVQQAWDAHGTPGPRPSACFPAVDPARDLPVAVELLRADAAGKHPHGALLYGMAADVLEAVESVRDREQDERPDRMTPRDELTGRFRAVSEVLDDYLMREYGRVTSHNGWDLFLDLLTEQGYEVRALEDDCCEAGGRRYGAHADGCAAVSLDEFVIEDGSRTMRPARADDYAPGTTASGDAKGEEMTDLLTALRKSIEAAGGER